MKKLFIGHFGGKIKEDWFFAWADDENNALETIGKEFGEPIFIKDISNISSGGFCFKPINISNDDTPYFMFEPFQDDFKFENDQFIQDIIINQILIKNDKEDIQREEYRKLIQKENIKQKKLEEKDYDRMREKIDNIK
jgi:regulatory protein YycH of two-component signal transduction system YycFG